MIRQLQARQAELEAENHALRQSHATRVDAMVDPDVVSAAIPSIATLEAEAQRHALQERVKELRCLYDIGALLNRGGLPQGELAQAIVDRLPAAYQFPEVTCASLTIDGQRFSSANFAETPWQQSGIVAGGKPARCTLTVGYLDERPAADEGPFIKEERWLINEVCTQLGHTLERRRLHEALAASERRFRALIENSSDGILLVGMDRQLRYASPSAARILGYEIEEFMQPGTLVIHPDDLEAIEDGWRRVYTMPERAVNQSYRACHQDGSWRWLEATVTNLLSDPAVEAVVVNFRDVTERRLAEIELAASNARFKSLFENMTLGVVYHAHDGRITLANRSAETILGLSHDQLMGHTSFDPRWKAVREDGTPFPGEEHPAMVALHTGKIVTDVLMGVLHPGKDEVRWIRIAAVPEMHPGETTPHRVFAIFDDITERRHVEQHVARSEWLYRTAILAAGAIPYQHDYATESYTFMPVEAKRLTGYSAGELTPALIESLLLEVNVRGQYAGLSLEEAVARARSGKDNPVWQCDYRVRTQSGEERWLADSSVQIVDDQGKPVASVGILQDITERMETEAALRTSEERYRLLVAELEERVAARTAEARDLYENAPCGYSTVNAAGMYTMVNQTELDWLGFTRDELIGHPVSKFLTPESMQVFADNFPRLVADGSIDDLEFELVRKDGSVLPVTLNAIAIYDAEGRFVESRGSIFDVTKRRQAQQAMQASEARLNYLLAHTPAIIYSAAITEQGVTTTFLSESTYRLLGYAPEAHQGDPDFWHSLIHPDDAPSGQESLKEFLAAGSTIWEHRVRHANGDYRWHATGMSRLRDDSSSHFIGYSVDIHERKLARDALRVSEERYRSVLQNAPVNIAEVDRRGAILSQNRTLLGAPVETIVGQTLFTIAPPDAAPAIRHALDAVFDRGESVQYESSLEVAPGDVRHFVSYAGPVGADRIESAVVVTMDVSELKQAQTALQQQRDFAQQVMDALGEGLVVGDRAQRAAYVNPFMAHLLESTPSELLGGALADYALAEDVPGVAKMLAEHGPEATHRYELRIVTTSGRVVPTLVSTTPRWVNGELAGRIAVFTDLTRIKQIEADLRQSGDELRAANVALEKAMQLKDEFLASMSHELRTPLTGILGLSESLQLQTFGMLNERQYRAVQYIWESGQHLLDLINDILDLSKLAADQLDLELEHCDVDTICRASLTLVKGMAGKKLQQFAYALESHGIAVRADSRRLKQMLVNLLSNAVKFTPEGGELGLRVRGDSTRRIVEFHVWDTGIGIDAADLPRLFQPFTQLDSSLTREHSGSGLGLALVHRMAQLHGGTIEVVSKPGAGSTFTLLLPMDESAPESEPIESKPPLAIPGPSGIDTSSTGGTGRLRLLVAEDDPINSEILHELLTAKGYRVLLAANGRELLRMAPDFAPALVIMDVRMPQMDGIEATRHLRSDPDPALANVPIIILTAQAMEGDAERCLAAGANRYIAKPYAVTSLLAAIETLLDAEDKPS
ncbi:MAG: PAS domain S-box protein [Caldilinea sp.]|nr:PAS domain S-box protein [Caldilinea sp.]